MLTSTRAKGIKLYCDDAMLMETLDGAMAELVN